MILKKVLCFAKINAQPKRAKIEITLKFCLKTKIKAKVLGRQRGNCKQTQPGEKLSGKMIEKFPLSKLDMRKFLWQISSEFYSWTKKDILGRGKW